MREDFVQLNNYEALRNNHCLNRWVKYFYECELFKKSLPSHRFDPRKDRYILTDSGDEALFEEKRKILYQKYVAGLQMKYKSKKTQRMKTKVIKLKLIQLRSLYLLTKNKKIYRYSDRFKPNSGFKKENFDVDTLDEIRPLQR